MKEHQAPYLTNDMARCAEYYRHGESSRWVSAFFAARIVGRRNGETHELAQALSVSDDTVESLARAAVTWKWLRHSALGEENIFRAISECRLRLTWSHFSVIGQLAKRLDLSALDVFSALHEAAESGTSVKAMAKLISDEHDESPIQDWRAIIKRAVNVLLDLATNADVPKDIALWAAKSAAAYQKLEDKL